MSSVSLKKKGKGLGAEFENGNEFMAPVMPLTAPPTLDVRNTFLREHTLDPNNCAHIHNNKINNDNNSSENDNDTSNRQQQQELPCQNGETKQQRQHSEQEGLSRSAAAALDQTVLDERDDKDLNGTLISGRAGTRASLDITIANHALIGRRKVSWSDTRGNDLVQIWEFQPSDSSDSDDDGEDDSQACACVIV